MSSRRRAIIAALIAVFTVPAFAPASLAGEPIAS